MNKFSIKLLLLAGVLSCAATASATTTLRFSVTGTNRATGFSDHNGTAGVDGMRYGIVIDTSATNGLNANGFQSGNYDVFDNTVSGFLKVGGVTTDDYYHAGSTTTSLGATGTDPGGSGGITSVVGAPNGTDGVFAGVSTSDPFALIWFESAVNANGSYYGLMTDASFQLPAGGSTVDFNAPFTGSTADPIKPASYQFGAAVPEPSRFLLAGLGLVGLVMRRRRSV